MRPIRITSLGAVYRCTYSKDYPGFEAQQGELDFEQNIIRVLDDANWEASTIHELLHGIFTRTGLAKMLGDKLEEAVITAVENGTKGVLVLDRDSPLIKWSK